MTLLPIIYSDIIIATAQVDDQFEVLKNHVWNARFAKRLLTRCGHRADVMVSYLREDITARRMLYPRTCIRRGFWCQLCHLILRPQLITMIPSLVQSPSSGDIFLFNEIKNSIGRIVYDDSDRTNCRLSNLREIKNASEIEATVETIGSTPGSGEGREGHLESVEGSD